jgi:hypothetical protein
MRQSVLRLTLTALTATMFACGGSTTSNGNPDAASASPDAAPGAELTPPPAGQGFQLVSPEITIKAGEEVTYCWYTTLPNTTVAGVKKWESRMTEGSHHLILYFTASADAADGTIAKDCSGLGGGGANLPVWTYSAQSVNNSATMPTGVGMTVAANQKAYIQMHYLNTTDADIKAHVAVNGWTIPEGTSYLPASAYVTYNTQIDILGGVGMTGHAEGSCDVPAGVNFFTLSTHAHKRAVHTEVYDGTTSVFASDNWEHPGAASWDPNFHNFGSKLKYSCDYVNDSTAEVKTGNSAKTDEMCMAVGYFFCPAGGSCSPATKPVFCINSAVIPL